METPSPGSQMVTIPEKGGFRKTLVTGCWSIAY